MIVQFRTFILQNADVAAVIMQAGLAHICLITSSMTIIRAKIDQVIPRKRKGNVKQHEKVGVITVQCLRARLYLLENNCISVILLCSKKTYEHNHCFAFMHYPSKLSLSKIKLFALALIKTFKSVELIFLILRRFLLTQFHWRSKVYYINGLCIRVMK